MTAQVGDVRQRRTRRWTLLVLLLATLLLATLLPRSGAVLGWAWTLLESSAAEAGFTLEASSLRGNLLTGLQLREVYVTNPALDITLDRLELDYSLLQLLRGTLPVDLSVSGVRGDVVVQDLLEQLAGPVTGSVPLSVSIGTLEVSDVQLAFSDAPEKYKLPDVSFSDFSASDVPGGFDFELTLATSEGAAQVAGVYAAAAAELRLELLRADLEIVRFWWEGIGSGNATGSVVINSAGVTADAQVHDASIHFLDATVSGINGGGQLRDLLIDAAVIGSGLGATISAEAVIDLAGQHFAGEAVAEPELDATLDWLAGLLKLDLNDVPVDGKLDVRASVSGWKEVAVSGHASGTGTVAARPLTVSEGHFGFTTADGLSVNVQGAYSGGQLDLDLSPVAAGPAATSASPLHLLAALTGAQLTNGSDLLLDAQADLLFGQPLSAENPNVLMARVHGPVAGRDVHAELQAASSDLLQWQGTLTGTDGSGSLLAGDLKLQDGLLSSSVTAALHLAGAEPAVVTLDVDAAPLALQLPLSFAAQWGPLTLPPLALQLTLAGEDANLELQGPGGSLALQVLRGGDMQLDVHDPPLLLAGTHVSLAGQLELPAGGTLSAEATGQAFGLDATATARGGDISGVASGGPDRLSGTLDSSGAWQLIGTLPLETLGSHFGVELQGSVSGSADGAAGRSHASFSGPLAAGSVSADARLELHDGQLDAFAVTTLLGERWELAASISSAPVFSARSSLGELTLHDGMLSGAGELPGGQPWQLTGSTEGSGGGASDSSHSSDGLAVQAAFTAGPLQVQAWAATDEGGTLTAGATAPGLIASWTPAGLDLDLDGFDAGLLLGVPPGLPVSGRVSGAPAELELVLSAGSDLFEVSAAGVLTGPTGLDVQLIGTALEGLVTASGQLTGSLEAPVLSAELSSDDVESEWFSLPALRASIALSNGLTDGLLLELAGGSSSGQLRLQDAGLRGSLNLPFRLLGEEHEVQLQVEGSAANPRLDATVTGPLLSGSGGTPADAEHAFSFAVTAGVATLLPQLPDPVTLRGSVSADGAWQMHAATDFELAAFPLNVGAQAQGRLLAYDGFLNIRSQDSGERLLSASFSGAGTNLDVRSDLQSLELTQLLHEAGSSGQLEPAGELIFSADLAALTDSAALQLHGSARGEAAGIPLDVSFTADLAENIHVTGLLAGEALDLQVQPSGTGAGSSSGSWAAATFEVTAMSAGTNSLELHGGFTHPTGQGSFRARMADGGLELQELQAQQGDFTLQAAGELLPRAAVRGEVTAGNLVLPLEINGTANDLHGLLGFNGLELHAALNPQLQLQLLGSSDLPGTALLVESDLRWNESAGFTGDLSAQGALPDATGPLLLQLQAKGQGLLHLSGALSHTAGSQTRPTDLLSLTARLPENPLLDRSLSGSVHLSASLRDALPSYAGRPLALSGSFALGGSVIHPELAGPLALTGPLEASGQLELTGYAASGSAALAGEHLNVSGSVTDRAWSADGRVSAQPLAAFLPWLPDAQLQASGTVNGAPGTRTQAQLDDFIVTTASSRLDASGTLGSDVQAIMNLNVDLADAQVGVPLTGRLQGTLTYGSTSLQQLLSGVLRGSLELTDAGLSGNDTSFSGSGLLLGKAQDPELSIRLQAGGSGSGELTLEARPARQEFSLRSTVATAVLTTDFSVTGAGPDLSAQGQLRLPDGAFTLTETEGERLALTGSGVFENWSARFEPAALRLELSAYLQTLYPALHGQVELSAGLEGGGVQLHGQVYGLQAAGFAVGDLTLSAPELLGGWIQLSGERITGRVQPAAGFTWELQRLELAAPAELSLLASGAGHGTVGAADLIISGSFAGESVNLPARVTLDSASLHVNSEGSALNGHVSLDAYLRGGSWSGQLAAVDLQAGGVTLSADGPISGTQLAPRAELSTLARAGGLSSRGSLTAAPGEVRFEQLLDAVALGETLTLSGSVLPDPELQITGESGQAFSLVPVPSDAAPFTQRQLTASGELQLEAGPVQLQLLAAADGRSAVALFKLPALAGLEMSGPVTLSSLDAFLQQLEAGVSLTGSSATRGELRVLPLSGELQLHDFGLTHPQFGLDVSGQASLAGDVGLNGVLRPGEQIGVPLSDLPFSIRQLGGSYRLLSRSDLGDIEAVFEPATGATSLTAALQTEQGGLSADLQFSMEAGPSGRISLNDLQIIRFGETSAALLRGLIDVNGERVTGDLHLELADAVLDIVGDWGLADLLPRWLAPRGQEGGEAHLQLETLLLEDLPFLSSVPHLTGTLDGELGLSDQQVTGSFRSPDLAAAGTPLPVDVRLTGTPTNVRLDGSLGASPLELTLTDGELGGLLELRRFPLHALARALAGPLDVSAEATGALRFSFPVLQPRRIRLQAATELVRLERAGIVTTGTVSLELADGVFSLDDALFHGAGRWEASGVLRSDKLDFRLEAEDADFGPLLGLIPQLVPLNVDASGSLLVAAAGSLQNPEITISSEQLGFSLAGISYELADTRLTLADQDLVVDAQLSAVSPVSGSLRVGGGSKLQLAPLQFSAADFTLAGSAVVPVVGPLADLDGRITSGTALEGAVAPLLLDLTGSAGAPFSLTGSLLPLDLRLSGSDLRFNLPALFLVDTQVDVDLRLEQRDGPTLSGSVFVDEALIALGTEAPDGQAAAAGPGRAALAIGNLQFDAITLNAPQRIRFNENFGTAELSAKLELGGSLRDPLLSGSVQALRGTLQFSGRDFEVREAVARFDPNSGLYPELDFSAVTTFEMNRALPPGSNYEFAAPRDRNRVEVLLSFHGDIERDEGSASGFRLSVQPILTSDARVQETRFDGLSLGPRSLTEAELLGLIALGRVEFGSIGTDPGGLATAVAEGALGTALDVLILSELQRALGDALGIDVVEIRSSAVSSLFSGGNGDAFSVSLRLGGYLSESVFASYRIGAFDDPRGLYAMTNEVLLTYGLGPLELDLAGRVHFTDRPELEPGTELSIGLRYAISELTSFETGIDLSNERQQLRFGVTLRW